jgi:hypothetical protein
MFPVPVLDLSKKEDIKKKDRLVSLVDKMLELKAETQINPARLKEIRQINDEIDGLVYGLCGLTEEEINVITTSSNEVQR